MCRARLTLDHQITMGRSHRVIGHRQDGQKIDIANRLTWSGRSVREIVYCRMTEELTLGRGSCRSQGLTLKFFLSIQIVSL